MASNSPRKTLRRKPGWSFALLTNIVTESRKGLTVDSNKTNRMDCIFSLAGPDELLICTYTILFTRFGDTSERREGSSRISKERDWRRSRRVLRISRGVEVKKKKNRNSGRKHRELLVRQYYRQPIIENRFCFMISRLA